MNKTAVVSTLGALMLATSQAQAAVAAGVTAAITDGVADVGIIGAGILLVVVAIAGFNWLRKPVH